jgi:uncharacterized protein with von Willebrand factor type A (vWA) domain
MNPSILLDVFCSMERRIHSGLVFSTLSQKEKVPFERLLDLFRELLLHTSGDVDEALDWLRQLDKEYSLTDENYGIDDFVQELKEKGFLRESVQPGGPALGLSSKMEQLIRHRALEQVFGQLRKSGSGDHRSKHAGRGDEPNEHTRAYQFGDDVSDVDMTASIKNAQIRQAMQGGGPLKEEDLEVREQVHKSQMATVLMIDLSHSMILYGEDRITPAKRVALALAELIRTRYPKDSFEILAFGNDAWPIELKDLPYLQVGPFHTNTVAGLDLASEMLRKKKSGNKQIFMITDGKPSCLKEADGSYYKNSAGLDDYIVGKCLNRAAALRKEGIPVTTFMIARDPWLQEFVSDFTRANNGKAFYTGLKDLGELVFEDYERNRKKKWK